MTSILNISSSNESKEPVSPGALKPSQDLGADWDSLRGLTKNTYQQRRPSTALRTVLLAILLIVGLGSLGLLFHNHMPALVNFGQELSDTFDRLTSGSPTPSVATHEATVPDLRSARNRRQPNHVLVPDLQADQVYDPISHPFYATTVIGGRRVALASNNGIVVLDVASGTWDFAPQSE